MRGKRCQLKIADSADLAARKAQQVHAAVRRHRPAGPLAGRAQKRHIERKVVSDQFVPADKRQEARTFMIRNARYMWFHNMDKTLYPKTFANYSFSSYYNKEGNPGSLGAHNSAAALLEGITRLTDL